jgi:threonine dehydrogenase-like Zn-dependent dehydrogenase
MAEAKKSKSVGRLNFEGETYAVAPNIKPIVKRQILIVPDKDSRGHRLDLAARDARLAIHLCRHGFRALAYKPGRERVECHKEVFQESWACYLNPFPGTGRSVPHLHINCVPAHYIPLLSGDVVPWQICSAKNGSTFSRLSDIGFYAIAIENSDDVELTKTVAEFHQHMNQRHQPYNFLVYPFRRQDGSTRVRVVIVPREQEYCEAADQRIAGLEFLTGALIPGPARLNSMDTIQRDLVFLQATLDSERQLDLERFLRGLYSLPPPGNVVRARTEGKVFKAIVELNDALIPQDAKAKPRRGSKRRLTTGRTAFGKIDSRSWRLSESPPKYNFRAKRLNANVLVRITRASICQSDRRVLAKKKTNHLDRGWALGHEGGGYIVDPGPWEGELVAGDKVVVLPHLSCGSDCEPCHRYMPNLCEDMKHLGFDLNGNLADLMAFPYQCVLPVGADFPDDALPLVEPLACVFRALFRIRRSLSKMSDNPRKGYLTIFGAGPMGCLAALAARRKWNDIGIRMIEPNCIRREVVLSRGIANEVLNRPQPHQQSAVSFVASSRFQSCVDAIESTEYGGAVMLFSGINKNEQNGKLNNHNGKDRTHHYNAKYLEDIHRQEKSVIQNDAFGKERVCLIGSSGYILDDVHRSMEELTKHYTTHYIKVQNVEVDGLNSGSAVYLDPPARKEVKLDKAVEALLSTRAVEDPYVAETLKVLIRL